MSGNDNNLVQAIYTFKGKNNDELCFKKGDVICVTQREEGGWWEGTLGEVTGWFPSNYVKEYKESGGGSAATSPIRAPSEVQAFRNVVLKDIIDSEKAHVTELQGLVNNFLKPLETSDILTKDEYKQLTGNIMEILQVHEELLSLIEECGSKQGPDQRVGGLFLHWAPKIKAVHELYCSSHPRAVCILDKYKDELDAFMERCGAVCPGILVLTTGLSKPFRRLDKYAAMLQELGRHVVESHPDRGDTHRAVVVYKDIASSCAATRRQKELELQVVTGAVRGWKCPTGLGEVLHMGSVALGAKHYDRYLVLFPTTLLILSVSKRMSAFVYEGSLPLTGIIVAKLEDTETRKNAFEISGPLIESIVAVCQTSAEAEKWVTLLQQHSTSGNQTHSPANQEDGDSSSCKEKRARPRNPRESIYHVTLPPSTYPPASPYAALSKYFAKLVRLRIITRTLLKQLLYIQPGSFQDLSKVKFRRRHMCHVTLKLNEQGEVESEYSDSESSESSTNSRECYVYESESFNTGRIARQDAVDRGTHSGVSMGSSCASNTFGYVRYYDSPSTKCDESDQKETNVDTCVSESDGSNEEMPTLPLEQCPTIRILPDDSFESNIDNGAYRVPLAFINQYSEGSDNSSFEIGTAKPYMACEDLVNMDQSVVIDNMGFETFNRIHPKRQSCPTKFVANKFNDSSLTSVCTPGWQSCSTVESKGMSPEVITSPKVNTNYVDLPISHCDSNVSIEMLENLEPPYSLSVSDSTCSDGSQDTVKMILEPPPMFQNPDIEIIKASASLKKLDFERHSLNSDKKIRRSSSKLGDSFRDKEHSMSPVTRRSQVSSSQYIKGSTEYNRDPLRCDCCNGSRCHSPRSSDSGVAGSCNMVSPENLQRDSLYSPGETRSLNEARYPNTLNHDFSMSTGEITKINFLRNKLTKSELEAAKFEAQCPCISPFSTPRTSCQASITSDNVVVGTLDSDTSVTNSLIDSIPFPPGGNSNQQGKVIHNSNVRPQLYRKPSKHSEEAKNVRLAGVNHGWSTPDVRATNQAKASTHYHMRIYREQSEPKESDPEERASRGHARDDKENTDKRRYRSRSEDLEKKLKAAKSVQPSHMMDANCSMSTNKSDMVATNHKRSHSFNNHHSYSQYLNQQQNNQSVAHYKSQHNEINSWLQASSEALASQNISPSNTNKLSSNSAKITAFEFAEKLSLSSNFKGWTVRNLRPAPPLRPLTNLGDDNSNVGAAHPYASLNRKVNSYEEDGLILRVIEAYCTSAKSRHTINSETEDELMNSVSGDWLTRSPSLPLAGSKGVPSPWPSILQLQQEVRQLKTQIKQEREERMLAMAAINPYDSKYEAKESKC